MSRRIVVEANPSVVGGTETFLAGMLSSMDRSLYRPLALFHSDGPTRMLLEERGVETRVINYASEDEAARRDVAALLRDERVELVQSSYFSPVLGLAAAQAGIPHVWRFGGHVDVVHERNSAHQRKVFLAVAVTLSRRIVCGSDFLRRQFDLVGHSNVEVIYNGLDLRLLDGDASDQGADPASVAMVAHLVEQKRHEDFIRAAALVLTERPHTRFHIFGAPYPYEESRRYADKIRDLATVLGVAHAFEFAHLSRNRFERMRQMTLFVLPSLNEGASNAILEAMALGKPVVAADSGGHPELVADGQTGFLVPPRDPAALAARIVELLAQPSRASAVGAAARAEIEARFDIRHCARQYEQLYDGIFNEAGG